MQALDCWTIEPSAPITRSTVTRLQGFADIADIADIDGGDGDGDEEDEW